MDIQASLDQTVANYALSMLATLRGRLYYDIAAA
jgi:hypothetical protein